MGFKAWNLLRMAQLSLPVPAAFVIGTRYCADPAADAAFAAPTCGAPACTRWSVRPAALGDARRPLLLSVRSGAPVSMPGMMDTVLNVGLCDPTVRGPAAPDRQPAAGVGRLPAPGGHLRRGRGRAAAGRLRRTAGGRARSAGARASASSTSPTCARATPPISRGLFAERDGRPFPQDPAEQLGGAIEAVFESWHSAQGVRIPAPERHRRRHRDRGDGATHGVRQRRRRIRRRRRLHPRPGHAASRRCRSTSCSTRRARTWSPGATRCTDTARLPSAARSRAAPRGSCATRSSPPSATCRSSSSRCRTAGSSCCRRGPASARRGRRCALRWSRLDEG